MDGFSQNCQQMGMNDFSRYSDPSASSIQPTDYVTENSPSFSDAGTTDSTRNYTNEENITLAMSNPKKRTGRKKFKETRHPVYRGVRMRNSNRWVCEIREPNKRNRIWLGTYLTAEMAARAHDVAALALRGPKSCLNFADSAWRLPKPASSDPEDIQRAAAEAAAMFSTDTEDANVDNLEEGSTAICNTDTYKDVCNESRTNGEPYESGQCQQLSFYCIDDEVIFNMPGILNDMAEGLLLSPPPSFLDGESTWDNAEINNDMTLWNHSL